MPKLSRFTVQSDSSSRDLSPQAVDALQQVGDTRKLFSRNVTIAGRRTSVRIDAVTWQTLGEVAAQEGMTVHTLCELIATRRVGEVSLTQAIRTFLISYLTSKSLTLGEMEA